MLLNKFPLEGDFDTIFNFIYKRIWVTSDRINMNLYKGSLEHQDVPSSVSFSSSISFPHPFIPFHPLISFICFVLIITICSILIFIIRSILIIRFIHFIPFRSNLQFFFIHFDYHHYFRSLHLFLFNFVSLSFLLVQPLFFFISFHSTFIYFLFFFFYNFNPFIHNYSLSLKSKVGSESAKIKISSCKILHKIIIHINNFLKKHFF
jgi:hypothetical protein